MLNLDIFFSNDNVNNIPTTSQCSITGATFQNRPAGTMWVTPARESTLLIHIGLGFCQAFSDYQMQQMTSNFIEQFGFNDEEFADPDDVLE